MALVTSSSSAQPSTEAAAGAAAGSEDPGAPNQVMYIGVSIAVCTLLFLVAIGGGLYLFYEEVPLAVAVGLFTAFWGGPGFGLMAGMALYNLAVERRADG